jgi:dimethylhistidine N-methyltransferase
MIPSRVQAPPAEAVADFAKDVKRDLALTPKQLQSKYLYDPLGSALFEAICLLPWYRITRAEGRLLRRFAGEMAEKIGGNASLVELGSGSGEKLALIADAMHRRGHTVPVHLIDISSAALEAAERTLGSLGHVSVVGHRATYEEGLRRATRGRTPGGRVVVLFLGSNIGNFDPPASQEFLGEIRKTLQPGDALLLGADLVKPESELLLAYDDPLGVTAAFNKNVLRRINTDLLADFDLDSFDHRALWNPVEKRVEMHLVARRAMEVSIPRAECVVHFERREHIWTESSYKYTAPEIVALAQGAGFRLSGQWIESDAAFALSLFEAG